MCLPLPLAGFLLLGPLLALQICSYLLARRCVSFPKPDLLIHTHAHLRHAAGEASYIASYIRQGNNSIFSQQSVFICSSCQCKLPVVEVPWSFFLIIINGMFFLFIQLSIITVSFFRLACCVFPSYFLIRAENNMTHLCWGKCILSACVGICVFASSSVGGLELVFASVVFSLLSRALQ